MLSEWSKFKGWKVLQYFLEHPHTRVGVKELARCLKISSMTTSTYLNLYSMEGLLNADSVANSLQHSLNNANSRVRLLKQFFVLQKIRESGFVDMVREEDPIISHLVLYGSYADGTYTEGSDIDLLVITPSKPKTEPFKHFESVMGTELGLTTMTYGQWRKAQKGQQSFAMSLLKNHHVLLGGDL